MNLRLNLIFLFVLAGIIHGQNHFNFDFSKLDSICQTTNPIPFNGVVLVTKNGKEIYSNAVGFSDVENNIPLRIIDQFAINSNSKLFTTILVLLELEKDNLELNVPIRRYLPELTDSWLDSVNIHQLMNHTNGIDDFGKPLLFQPGSDFKYGNISNRILRIILSNVTGKPYRDLANELFNRLGLENTYLYGDEGPFTLINSYRFDTEKFNRVESRNFPEEDFPAFGIISTVRDLAKWNELLHNGHILNSNSYDIMVTSSVYSQHNAFGKEEMGYGYNIRIAEQNGVKYVGHTGLGQGFTSLNIYFPEEKISLVILENILATETKDWYNFEIQLKDELICQILENSK